MYRKLPIAKKELGIMSTGQLSRSLAEIKRRIEINKINPQVIPTTSNVLWSVLLFLGGTKIETHIPNK
jgi:hypothetical protein